MSVVSQSHNPPYCLYQEYLALFQVNTHHPTNYTPPGQLVYVLTSQWLLLYTAPSQQSGTFL